MKSKDGSAGLHIGARLRFNPRHARSRQAFLDRAGAPGPPSRRRCSKWIRCGRNPCESLAARLDHRVWVDEQDHCLGDPSRRGRAARHENGLEQKSSHLRVLAVPPAHNGVDQAGNLVRSWGGPGPGYEWPEGRTGSTSITRARVAGRQRQRRRPRPQVHQGGEVPDAAGRYGKNRAATTSRTSAGWPRSGSIQDNEASTSPTAIFNKRVAVVDADTQDEALLGRVRQQADDAPHGQLRPKAPPAQQFRNPVTVSSAERRSRLRVRPPGRPVRYSVRTASS